MGISKGSGGRGRIIDGMKECKCVFLFMSGLEIRGAGNEQARSILLITPSWWYMMSKRFMT